MSRRITARCPPSVAPARRTPRPLPPVFATTRARARLPPPPAALLEGWTTRSSACLRARSNLVPAFASRSSAIVSRTSAVLKFSPQPVSGGLQRVIRGPRWRVRLATPSLCLGADDSGCLAFQSRRAALATSPLRRAPCDAAQRSVRLLFQNFDPGKASDKARPGLLTDISATSFSRAVLRRQCRVSSARAVDARMPRYASSTSRRSPPWRRRSPPVRRTGGAPTVERRTRLAALLGGATPFLRRGGARHAGATSWNSRRSRRRSRGWNTCNPQELIDGATRLAGGQSPREGPAILSQSAVTAWDCAADGDRRGANTTLALTTLANDPNPWRSMPAARKRAPHNDLRPSSRRRSSSAFLEAAAPAAVDGRGWRAPDLHASRDALDRGGARCSCSGPAGSRSPLPPGSMPERPRRWHRRARGAPRLSTSPSASSYAAMDFLGDRFIIATSEDCANPRGGAWMWRALEGAPRRTSRLTKRRSDETASLDHRALFAAAGPLGGFRAELEDPGSSGERMYGDDVRSLVHPSRHLPRPEAPPRRQPAFRLPTFPDHEAARRSMYQAGFISSLAGRGRRRQVPPRLATTRHPSSSSPATSQASSPARSSSSFALKTAGPGRSSLAHDAIDLSHQASHVGLRDRDEHRNPRLIDGVEFVSPTQYSSVG